MTASSKNSKIIHAPREKVYHAFTDKKALEYWLAPDNMTGRMHAFDPGEGGGYCMTLSYTDSQATGKTIANEDRFYAKFIELKPFEKIVEAINFQTDRKEFTGEMIMEVFLEEWADRSTKVTMVFSNIPPGIDPEDNRTGTEQSLSKLARYLTGAEV